MNNAQSGPNAGLFIDEANYLNQVQAYGVCGKFGCPEATAEGKIPWVYLPTITGFIEGTNEISNVGGVRSAGLPNITGNTTGGNIGNWGGAGGGAGTMFQTSLNTGNSGVASGQGQVGTNIRIDASRFNSIYGNSTTVQPQSTSVFYYVCLGKKVVV